MADPAPIVVAANPEPAQLTAGVRQIILLISGALTLYGAGHLGANVGKLAALAGPIAGVISFVFGQIHIRTAAQRQATMANALPDSIAKVKA